MGIQAITAQPGLVGSTELIAAYRPIYFSVFVDPLPTAQPPVVYCDIYLNSVFYKTIAKTVPYTTSSYEFDIQDAAQEYLTAYLGSAASNIHYTYEASGSYVFCFVKFRVSSLDANGFIVPQTVVPIQATDTTAAVSGDGNTSYTFIVINATLQHEQNQNLKDHLNFIKSTMGTWGSTTWPLTHRPANYKVCVGDLDYFPLITSAEPRELAISWINKDGSTDNTQANLTRSGLQDSLSVWYLPNGPKNLAVLFPSINWSLVVSYTLSLLASGSVTVATWTNSMGCCCASDKLRVHFRNAMGSMDAINFIRPQEEHFNSSGSKQKSLPQYGLLTPDKGKSRYNVESNEKYLGINQCYNTTEKNWIIELLDTTDAYLEWTGIEGRENSYLPIIIADGKMETVKATEKYFYEILLEFFLANENINIRN